MSSHPNALLILVGKIPARFTEDNYDRNSCDFLVNFSEDEEYDDSYQITVPPFSAVIYSHLTYGYGDTAELSKIDEQKAELIKTAEENGITDYKCLISANYW